MLAADASCRAAIFDNLFCVLEPELSCGPSVAGKVSLLPRPHSAGTFVLQPP